MARENCKLLPALCLTVCFCLGFCTSVTAKWPHKKSTNKCPTPCLCSKENVYVRCTKVDQVPRYLPANATFLTFHNATFGEITNGTFSHFPSLHLILLKDSTFNIKDNAFKGLRKLQYLFIDNNNIQSISGNAFQGLKSLTHLSLSNNKLQSLPRNIFDDLDSLTEVDLRGNSFSCNCKNKWLVTWLQVINASIPEVYCATPLKFSGRPIRSLRPEEFDCFATEFVEFQTLHMHSFSVESYIYRGDVNVVLAQPLVGKCTFLEWDHVEGLFRVFDNITGQAVISCKPVVIDDQLVVIMAQLVGGSHIYKRDEHSRRFLKIQDIDRDKIRKPSDVETFQIEGEQYAIITDSSKAGVTTLYRWNGNGFYSQQSLHHWYRDTDGELVHILGGAQLVLTSSSQLPVLYEWDREQGLFSQGPHTNIPDVEDAVTVRSFTHAGQLYLCLTRYIGDSKVMKWNKSSFQEVQTMPSRGSMLLQPFHVGLRQYGVLGSDFAFSQVFRWDADIDAFVKLQELNVQAPRAFTVVSVGKEDFLFASSFTSKTVIYRHHVVDTSL